jgi:putative transposase
MPRVQTLCEAYKRDKSQRVAFRPDGAVVYDERILSFQGLEAVRLTTLHGREVVPRQMGDYQRVQFQRARGQADLVLVKGTFYLLVTLDTPEEPPMVPERFLGVDLGVINLATDSDGHPYTGTDVETRSRSRVCGASKARSSRCGPGTPATQRLPPGPG